MFESLDEGNFELYGAKHYINPRCLTVEDFRDDISKFKYVVRLLNKYEKSGILNERLILNHLIVIYAMFETKAANRMLFYKVKDALWPPLKAFMLYLNRIPESDCNNITIDLKTINRLKEL